MVIYYIMKLLKNLSIAEFTTIHNLCLTNNYNIQIF
jgi:hypothetical protein